MSTTGTGIKQRALEMLALNMPQSAVAGRLGITEGAVSQLMADPAFLEALESKRVQISEKDQAFDDKLEKAEEDALDRIAARVQFGNLRDSLSAFKVLNSARRRKDSQQHTPTNQGTAVLINMPVTLIPQFVINQKSEVVEVDGKTMLSASPAQMNKIMEERTGVVASLAQDNQKRAAAILEGAVRSVVAPVKRQTRNLQTSLVDLL